MIQMKAYQIKNNSNCIIGVVNEKELNELKENGILHSDDTITEVELED